MPYPIHAYRHRRLPKSSRVTAVAVLAAYFACGTLLAQDEAGALKAPPPRDVVTDPTPLDELTDKSKPNIIVGKIAKVDEEDRRLVVTLGDLVGTDGSKVRGVRTLDLGQDIGDATEEAADDLEIVMLFVPESAKIVLEEKPAVLRDLHEGDKVRIITDSQDKVTARSVVASRKTEEEENIEVNVDVGPHRDREKTRSQRTSTVTQEHSWLGAEVAPTPGNKLLVVRVYPRGPADAAGLAVNDFIIEIEERDPPRLRSSAPLGSVVDIRPGQRVQMTVWRNGVREMRTLIAEPPRPAQAPAQGISPRGPRQLQRPIQRREGRIEI